MWCAAGKGTFGTKELVSRIKMVDLSAVVSHRRLILPQLGAVGIAAHEIRGETGFNVTYGPVRAEDLTKYLINGQQADKAMRKVRFNTTDRAVLVPMEVVSAVKPTVTALGALAMANAVGLTKFDSNDVKAYTGAVLIGSAATPLLLPVIPARAFSAKGWLLGLSWAMGVNLKNGLFYGKNKNLLKASQNLLVLPSVSAIHAMNFTGSSTYTSMSGVRKEMKTAVPLIGASLLVGAVLAVIGAHKGRGKR